jgi:hypothetical protein
MRNCSGTPFIAGPCTRPAIWRASELDWAFHKSSHAIAYFAFSTPLRQLSIDAIVSGRYQMDAFVRRYIHQNLCYRFVMLPNGAAAYAVETTIKNGEWENGRPLLNPGRWRARLTMRQAINAVVQWVKT